MQQTDSVNDVEATIVSLGCPYGFSQATLRFIDRLFVMIALFLAWRCNENASIMTLCMAICCPYIFIPWALATKCQGINLFS